MAGYIAKYGKPDQSKGQHLTDEFKLPNHITFSTESKYNTPEATGGEWKQIKGKWHFFASPYNVKQHGAEKMQQYFKSYEPDAMLHLPDENINTSFYKQYMKNQEQTYQLSQNSGRIYNGNNSFYNNLP